MARDLTVKQRRFKDEYLIDYNASRAALAAGYSKKTAMFIGAENLKKPKIKYEIELEMAKRAAKSEVTAERIINELALIAFSDITAFVLMGKKGITLQEFKKLPKDVKRCISTIQQNGTGVKAIIKFKLYDKVRALELLGKTRAMFVDKVKVQDDRSHIRQKLSELTTEDLRKIANESRN